MHNKGRARGHLINNKGHSKGHNKGHSKGHNKGHFKWCLRDLLDMSIPEVLDGLASMGENARFKNGHARVSKRARVCFKNASVSKKCWRLLQALVDSVSVRFENASVSEKCF